MEKYERKRQYNDGIKRVCIVIKLPDGTIKRFPSIRVAEEWMGRKKGTIKFANGNTVLHMKDGTVARRIG